MVLVALLCFHTLVKLYIPKMRVFMMRPWTCLHYLSFLHQFFTSTSLKCTHLFICRCCWLHVDGRRTWFVLMSWAITPDLWPPPERGVAEQSVPSVSGDSLHLCTFPQWSLFNLCLKSEVFLVMPGRTSPCFVPDMWLWESVAVATQLSAFPCFHLPETQTFVVARVDSTAVFLFSSCCVVFTAHVLSD